MDSKYFYHVLIPYKVILNVMQLITIGVLIHRLVKEIRRPYVDLFKVALWITFMLNCVTDILLVLFTFVFVDDILTFWNIYLLSFWYVFAFQVTNEGMRVTTIMHLNGYREISNGKKFSDINRALKRKEWLFLSWFVIFITTYHVIWFVMLYSQVNFSWASPSKDDNWDIVFCLDHSICRFQKYAQKYILLFSFVASASFIILGVLIFILLLRTLKKRLFRYYSTNKRQLIMITIISTISFSSFLIFYAFAKYTGGNPSLKVAKQMFDDKEIKMFIFWCSVRLLINFILNFYALYNIKNVDFKMYLEAIMFGYSLKTPLEHASIFIIRRNIQISSEPSSENSANTVMLSQDEPSLNIDTPQSSSFQLDNDDFGGMTAMQNDLLKSKQSSNISNLIKSNGNRPLSND